MWLTIAILLAGASASASLGAVVLTAYDTDRAIARDVGYTSRGRWALRYL